MGTDVELTIKDLEHVVYYFIRCCCPPNTEEIESKLQELINTLKEKK